MKGSELTKPSTPVDTIRGKGLTASIPVPSPKTRIGCLLWWNIHNGSAAGFMLRR